MKVRAESFGSDSWLPPRAHTRDCLYLGADLANLQIVENETHVSAVYVLGARAAELD